jgi:hypothetical protein
MKIISGGQTGVDRAALDFAISRGIPHGGWCPLGRLAEDGVIPPRYQLQEMAKQNYSERTERNVLDSDATLIVARDLPLKQGTLFTKECAAKHGRPVLIVCESDGVEHGAALAAEFLQANAVQVLNVAGPRASEAPGIGAFVHEFLSRIVNRGE